MGISYSKKDENKALHLCKERLRFIKQTVDLRYALSAAQLSYTQSLRNMGAALRQFAEADILVDPEAGQTTPQSSYASPPPYLVSESLSSPHGGLTSSPRLSNISYMRSVGSASVKFALNSSSNHYVEEEGEDTLTFPMPPPPPFPEIGSSWDFFDPIDVANVIKIPNGEFAMRQHFGKFAGLRKNIPSLDVEIASNSSLDFAKINSFCGVNGSVEPVVRAATSELCRSKIVKSKPDRQIESEREDLSKLVTCEAKDFISSVKDIEYRFIRASESGHEVSRMLETKKIRLSIHSKILGERKSSEIFSPGSYLLCCKSDKISERDTIHHVTKIITWRRSISSRSSSSRNHLTLASRDECTENVNDFIEEFSMISGSHSSTLERLYAWERKLYDELKACESITKAYDQKCNQLRHQVAKDMNSQVIDKTRAAVKDLHSRVRVTIQAVDSVSRRIEKLRDEELQPQLVELIQGLIRMWKSMLECHQVQLMAISSAHLNNTFMPPSRNAISCKQAAMNLRNEIECFSSSFLTLVDTQISYSESLNGWLQKCVRHPHERSRGRKVPFSPRRALAPPIFVLCRDWLAGIKPLPTEDVCGSLEKLMAIISEMLDQQKGDKQADSAEAQMCEANPGLLRLKESMISTFERLVKFSEELVKAYEGVKQESQIAQDAYASSDWFRL